MQIPLGVDIEFFKPLDKQEARTRFGIDPAEFVFLSFGRLSPSDKVDLMPILRGFRRVVDATQLERQTRLIITGSDGNGRYTDILQQLAQDLGLQKHVTILRNFNAGERPSLYSLADVFLGLSDTPSESFGLAVIEALCCGIPIVAAEWNGYKESVKDGVNGFTVPVLWSDQLDHLDVLQLLTTWTQGSLVEAQSVAIDIDSLVETMIKCALAPPMMLEGLSRAALHARDIYSWGVVIRQYEELWRTLGNGPVSCPDITALPITQRGKLCRSHPSQMLEWDMVLTLSTSGVQVSQFERAPSAFSELVGAGFDEELAQMVIRVVADCGNHVCVDDVVNACGAYEDSVVLWHILWLTKQGYLRTDDSRSVTGSVS